MRAFSFFFIAVQAAACALGGCFSRDPGAPLLFAKFFALGSLSALLPLALFEGPVGFSCGFVGYWAALAGLGFAPVLRAHDAPAWAWAVISLVWAVSFAAAALRRKKAVLGSRALLAAAFLVCVLTTVSSLWSTGYVSPSSLDKIIAGSTHQDTYQLATMAATTRRFGVPSIALDGLRLYHYHYLSVAAFAAVEKLSGCSAIQCYALFYPAIWPSLFLLMICLVARRITGGEPPAAEAALAAAVLTSGIIYAKLLDYMVAWEPLQSESYGFAVVLFMAGLLALPLPVDKRGPAIVRVVLWVLWLVIVSLSKISIGALACVVLCGAALLKRWRTPRAWAEAAVVVAAFLLCHKTNVDPLQKEASMGFSLFWFPRKFAHGGIKITPVWMIVHWLPMWVAVGLYAFKKRINDVKILLASIAAEPYALVLGPALGFGLLGSSLTITGGSGFYFTNQPAVFALPWAVALFLSMTAAERKRLKPAILAVLAATVVFQGYPRLRDFKRYVVDDRPRQVYGTEASEEMRFLIDTRSRLSEEPLCGLRVGHDWLWHGRFTDTLPCWAVPNIITAVLERPLYGSFMRPECRHDRLSYLKNHPQRDEPAPETLCREAVADGLSCVETLEGRQVSKSDCR